MEVLVASAVLSLLAIGLLATTWRMAGFARDEAERMMADSLCHDIMWAVYSQKYKDIVSIAPFTIDEANLPRIVSANLFAGTTTTYPLWRSQNRKCNPQCAVSVRDIVSSPDANGVTVANKEITVSIRWFDAKMSEVVPNQTLTVIRSSVRRGESSEEDESK